MIPKLILYAVIFGPFMILPVAGQEASPIRFEGTVFDLDLSQIGMNRVRYEYPWLDGSGIRVSIREEAFDTSDADLVGRYLDVGRTSERSTEHATAMATVIGGAGNTSVRGLGVAPAVQLSSSDLAGLVPDPVQVYRQNRIFLQNHSYGGDHSMPYNEQARAYDQSMYEEQRLLHIFSSGNTGSGSGLTRLGRIPQGANLSGPFKQAKNVLLVGAIDTIQQVWDYSARGPTFDGRIKPDLVTYALFGSSNAAALTTGVCALLQQAHLENQGSYPSAALLKAVLIQSATDLGAPGPDHLSGFGALNAYEAVQTLMEEQYAEATLTGKNDFTLEWALGQPGDHLRIALAWIDPPATDTTGHLLVHDLDLQLITPAGDTLLPWTIPFTDRSDLSARRGRDTLNNVEVISFSGASAGTYQVLVSGNMPDGVSQDFSLAYGVTEQDRFQWIYPLASDPVPFTGEPFTYVQWDTDQTGVASLEAQFAGSSDWVVLSDSVFLENGRWRWEIPVRMHGLAQLRLRTNTGSFSSDTFRISHPIRPNISLSCGDSMLFEWSPSPGAEGYRVWIQQGGYLEPVSDTKDTLFFWRKPEYPNTRIAVQPIYSERSTALKSPSYSIEKTSSSCYFSSLFAFGLTNKGGMMVLGELGTRWKVQEIIWQRKGPNSPYRELAREVPASDSLRYFDPDPIEGLNFYRVVLKTTDGQTYYSRNAVDWFVGESRVKIFPNPIQRGRLVRIYTRAFNPGEQAELRCYNAAGQVVRQYAFTEERMHMVTSTLTPGYYVLEVRGLGEVIRQPLIIQ